MRSSIVLTGLCAALAIASPVRNQLKKKALVTDIVTEIVYVTVTDGVTPIPDKTVVISKTKFVEFVPSSSSSSSSSTSTPPPPPPTTTSTPPPPPPTTTPVAVAPAPTPEAQVASVAAPTAAAAAAPAPQAPSSGDYVSTALYHHNVHRANHSASDLSWDDTLASYALNTAQTCVFAHDMSQGGGGYGQNLAAYGVSNGVDGLNKATLVADAITNQWYYGEVGNMPYGQDSPSVNGPEFLHFTQVVWKSSSTVGCATVVCPAGSIFSYASLYTVCDYKSAGNMMGEFIAEVSPPIGAAGVTATIS
jgi:uncharacterized protein YkwD